MAQKKVQAKKVAVKKPQPPFPKKDEVKATPPAGPTGITKKKK